VASSMSCGAERRAQPEFTTNAANQTSKLQVAATVLDLSPQARTEANPPIDDLSPKRLRATTAPHVPSLVSAVGHPARAPSDRDHRGSSRIITARAPCETGVECGEIIAASGQCVVKRVSEVPALPQFPSRRNNCRLLACPSQAPAGRNT
jgi:hypothetical protein